MTTRFFTTDDPDIEAQAPYIERLMEPHGPTDPGEVLSLTSGCSYPRGYEAIQFHFEALFFVCRKVRLIAPSWGLWITVDRWARPSEAAECHYTKLLGHMSFPQIMEYEGEYEYAGKYEFEGDSVIEG
jgi:hypothetical protein